jgi:hypothetical protein
MTTLVCLRAQGGCWPVALAMGVAQLPAWPRDPPTYWIQALGLRSVRVGQFGGLPSSEGEVVAVG